MDEPLCVSNENQIRKHICIRILNVIFITIGFILTAIVAYYSLFVVLTVNNEDIVNNLTKNWKYVDKDIVSTLVLSYCIIVIGIILDALSNRYIKILTRNINDNSDETNEIEDSEEFDELNEERINVPNVIKSLVGINFITFKLYIENMIIILYLFLYNYSGLEANMKKYIFIMLFIIQSLYPIISLIIFIYLNNLHLNRTE